MPCLPNAPNAPNNRNRPVGRSMTESLRFPFHASCTVMRVTYFACVTEQQQTRAFGDIRIVIPGDRAALHVTQDLAAENNNIVRITGNRIGLVPANQRHIIGCQAQSEMLVMFLDRLFFERKAREAFAFTEVDLPGPCAADDAFLKAIGAALMEEFQMQRIPGATYLECLASIIAIHLARNYAGREGEKQQCVGLPSEKLNEVEAFIDEHLAEALTVRRLAATIKMSQFHFARMFKAATGSSPHFHVTMRRVAHAKRLLRSTDVPLVGVATSVGFQSDSHFANVFQRFTGLTPRAYRLNCQDVACEHNSF